MSENFNIQFLRKDLQVAFHKGLSDGKSPQDSRTFLSIQADLNCAMVWAVSIRLLNFNFNIFFSKLLGIVPRVQNTSIIVIFMIHSFFTSLLKSRNLFIFSLSFIFNLWSARMAK